jgi:hypothetical protein
MSVIFVTMLIFPGCQPKLFWSIQKAILVPCDSIPVTVSNIQFNILLFIWKLRKTTIH